MTVPVTPLGDLPLISVNPCSSVAGSIALAGLGAVCQVTSGATHVASSAASDVAGFGADTVLNALGSWVSDGAAWLLGQIGAVISQTTTIDLGAGWFTSHYRMMAVLSAVVIVPLMLLGIIQSIYRQNASALVRSVLVNVPLAILLTAVAVKLVQLGLAVTDDLSSAMAQGTGLASGHYLASVARGLSDSSADGQPAAPAFVLFIGGLVVVFGALMVWVELLIRAAAVYVAVLFLPLALASLAWPAIAHWCRRLVDTLVALVLGKFVIVAVLSLAVGAVTGGGGFAAVLAGAALLLLAAFAPWALFRLLPFLEAGAVGHLEGLSQRAHRTAAAPVRGLAHEAMGMARIAAFAHSGSGGAGTLLDGALAARAGTGRGGGASGVVAGGIGGIGGGGGFSGGGAGGGPSRPDGPAGGGTPGDRPDTGPSSAASTGVGTMESPGHGIPAWTAHPEASIAGARAIELSSDDGSGAEWGGNPGGGWEGAVAGGGPTVGGGGSAAGGGSVVGAGPAVGGVGAGGGTAGARSGGGFRTGQVLPRQTGALVHDTIGRDRMGIQLISVPITPPAAPPTGPAAPPPHPAPGRVDPGTDDL